MNNLYIVGNGFDLYHGLDTRYQSFAKFLSQTDSEIYDLMLKYYGLPDISEDQVNDEEYNAWAAFEISLADLDYQQVLEDHSDSIANIASDDFRDRDWYTYQIDMELIIEKLTKKLISLFNKFILNVKYPECVADRSLEIISKSRFLNFNYTDTLERYYEVERKEICYIHGKSSRNDSRIILGHGTDPSNFEVKHPQPPGGLTKDELDQWKENMSDQYDYSYENAKGEILSYYTKAFKDAPSIIDKNIEFFEGLKDNENIYVLGHSISPVDIKYFEAVQTYSPEKANWFVTYFRDFEKQKHLKALTEIGIKHDCIKQLRMTELGMVNE